MRKFIAVAALLAAISPPALAAEEHTHAEKVAAFAVTAAMTTYAQSNCPGMKAPPGPGRLLATVLGVTEADAELVAAAGLKALEMLAKGRGDMGTAAWCAGAWELFGPKGSEVPGLLDRAD